MNTRIISGMFVVLERKPIRYEIILWFLWFDLASDWSQHNEHFEVLLSVIGFSRAVTIEPQLKMCYVALDDSDDNGTRVETHQQEVNKPHPRRPFRNGRTRREI